MTNCRAATSALSDSSCLKRTLKVKQNINNITIYLNVTCTDLQSINKHKLGHNKITDKGRQLMLLINCSS